MIPAARDEAVWEEIRAHKRRLGSRLIILTHHYQRPDLVALGDARGDSFELSRLAAEADAEEIVFCGVHFMAQAAAVLARPEQRVYHPNPNAGCPMADMAERREVVAALEVLARLQPGRRVIPLTYMNTLAEVKAVVGERGGAVCTSSNAHRAFTWAFARGDTVLFLPDEHLGRNTARRLQIPEADAVVYDPRQGELGGLTEDQLARARLILWGGYCHVHTWFTIDHIAQARARWPGCEVHVHPECRAEVVAQADGSGSTGYLVKVVEESPPGSTLVIGTEVNLVQRLAMEHPGKHIHPLDRSLCPNMYRITPRHLLTTLDKLPEHGRVQVDPRDREAAKLALERMLSL